MKKSQLARRFPLPYLQEILSAFNQATLDAASAAHRLLLSLSRLYELRHHWLQNKTAFQLTPSGGDHQRVRPPAAHQFLADCLPHSQPSNFACVAEELARLFDFHRSRAALAADVRAHFPQFAAPLKPGRKRRRRWQCEHLGELWEHDSSPHPWWPAESYPTLITTLDANPAKSWPAP